MSEALLAAIIAGQEVGPATYTFTRSIDRSFSGDTPASGGGSPTNDFVHDGVRWRLHQIIPFITNAAIGTRGECRIQIRNRDIGLGAHTLDMMPDRIVLTRSEWTGSPWVFNRDNIQPGRPGGNRVQVNYSPVRSIGAGDTAAGAGVSNGDEFTVTLEWDA